MNKEKKKGSQKRTNQTQQHYIKQKIKMQANRIYKWMAFIGLIIAFGAVGRSDYSRFEPLPGIIMQTLIGFALMIPMYIHNFRRGE